MPYPQHIQTLLDAGVAYEDMDGCVRMCSGYIDGGFPLPKIDVHVENYYTINYYIQTQTPVTTMEKLVNTEIHNNHGVVISGGNNHVSITVKDGELQSVQSAPVVEEVTTIPTTPQPNYPQPNTHADIPPELATEAAMELWAKFQQAGWVDAKLQPTVSRTMAAILADEMASRLELTNKWAPFELLWQRRYMRSDFQRAYSQPQTGAFIQQVKTILKS